MKRFLMILMVGLLFSTSLFAQQYRPGHDWTVHSSAYDFNMTLVVQVQQNGVLDPNLEIGAFCGEECRGTASAHYESVLNKYLWYFVIHGNNGDNLSFYVREGGVEMDLETDYSLVFSPNAIIGNPATPPVINFTSQMTHDYLLVTDASQLVAGRSYLIASGSDGTIAAMGRQDGGKRTSVSVAVDQHKTNLMPAGTASDTEKVFAYTMGSGASGWTLFDAVNEGYLEDGTNNHDLVVNTTSQVSWTININADGTATFEDEARGHYMASYGNEGFYCSDSRQNLSLFAQCELISGEQASLEVTDNASMYVVPSGNTFTVDELSTVHVSNLIVEEGAQLVNASNNVLATLQKRVNAYTNPDLTDGWYTIAAPLKTAAVASHSNLTVFDYDLYEYDETNLSHEEWRNYKAPNSFEDFNPGKGYLYANNTDMTVNLFGILNVMNVNLSLTYTDERNDELKGFNLIGNPYSHTIYKGHGAALDDDRLADGYYILSNDGAWQVKTYTDPILPGTGFMVLASEEGNYTIAKTTSAATAESNAKRGSENNLGRLSLSVSDGASVDVAYLYGGTEGRNLRKIAHMNGSHPELSFCMERERYAIAHQEGGEGMVDVCFDRQGTASYTMTWDVADWHGSHPYLMDNRTGNVVDMLALSTYSFETRNNEHPFRFKLILKEGFGEGDLFIPGLQGKATVQFIDITGRLIDTRETMGSLSTEGLTPGVYVLRLITDDKVTARKIVVP